VEYEVQRLLEVGKVSPRHVRSATTVRGLLAIAQEEDPVRHRAVLVARLTTQPPAVPIPPLYDVTIVSLSGTIWTLAGYERIESGSVLQPQIVGQAWIVEPVFIQDLIDVEHKWAAAHARVHQLEQHMLATGLQPLPPKA
jgi:hypothetical protein